MLLPAALGELAEERVDDGAAEGVLRVYVRPRQRELGRTGERGRDLGPGGAAPVEGDLGVEVPGEIAGGVAAREGHRAEIEPGDPRPRHEPRRAAREIETAASGVERASERRQAQRGEGERASIQRALDGDVARVDAARAQAGEAQLAVDGDGVGRRHGGAALASESIEIERVALEIEAHPPRRSHARERELAPQMAERRTQIELVDAHRGGAEIGGIARERARDPEARPEQRRGHQRQRGHGAGERAQVQLGAAPLDGESARGGVVAQRAGDRGAGKLQARLAQRGDRAAALARDVNGER